MYGTAYEMNRPTSKRREYNCISYIDRHLKTGSASFMQVIFYMSMMTDSSHRNSIR